MEGYVRQSGWIKEGRNIMPVKLTLQGYSETITILKRLETQITGKEAQEVITAGALVIEQWGKRNIDKQGLRGRTGNLINSYHVHETGGSGTKVWADVGSRGVIYARIHEFGGMILPKRFKFLHWISDPRTKTGHFAGKAGSGDEVFAKRSVIPARPYHRPAIDEHKGAVGIAIKTAVIDLENKVI